MIYSIVYYSIFIVYVQYGASVVFNNSFILGYVLEAVKRAYHDHFKIRKLKDY